MADEKEKPEDDKAKAADGAEGGEGAEGAEGEAGKKKSKKKLFIIIGLVAVLLIGGGVGAFMMMGKGHKAQEEVKEQPIFYTMPEMIINLSSPGKQTSFVKMLVILELPHAIDAVTVEANLPRLMDAFNTYVRELRPSDLAGSAGITRLREELLLRANKALDPTKVNDVLFKSIVVQ